MKILMISYHFPPEDGSCSDKNIKMLNALIDSGVSVDVLTVGNDSLKNNIKSSVYRVKGGIFHRGVNEILSDCSSTTITDMTNKRNSIKKFIRDHIIPDPVIDWYPNVIRWAKTVNWGKYDLILSISSPYSAHIISEKLSRKYNVPFICTYGDPWIYEPSRKRSKLRYAIEFCLEKRVVKRAKKIFVITDYNKRKYSELYNLSNDKIDTFNIGFDQNMVKNIESNVSNGKIHLIYGGSLNPVHRNPYPFVDAVNDMPNKDIIHAVIYNNDYTQLRESVEKFGIQDIVEIKDLVPSEQFRKELYKSNVLLLFGNKTTFQVPGKIFEYIATGIHILYIRNNNSDDDASLKILQDYGNVTVTSNDKKDIIDAIERMHQLFSSDKILNEHNRERYEYHETMRNIVDYVKNFKK